MRMEKKLHLVSLGCTKNLVDSEVMLGRLKAYTLTNDATEADLIIVNTCGFIDAAKEESIRTILDLHRVRKDSSLLVMSGCLSERYKEQLMEELGEVDLFTGVGDYDRIDELIETRQSHFAPTSYLIGDEERVITGSRSHAYIKLAEGCNQRCSFCAIPSFKGRLRSRPLENVVKEVERLIGRGFYDFSFISQDSSSYLRERGVTDGLYELIEAIEAIEGVKSARILYLYPSTLSERVIERIADSRVFHNYFDMPIQHISDRMLKIMRRGSPRSVITRQLELMRRMPDSFLRTSVIVGHPGEREEDFEELCAFLEEFDFDRITIFAYSDEEGTDAFKLEEKIDQETINSRIERIEKIVESKMEASLGRDVGTQTPVIPLKESEESSFFISARKLIWAEEIDGEILINENLTDAPIRLERPYLAKITQRAGDKLVATLLRPL